MDNPNTLSTLGNKGNNKITELRANHKRLENTKKQKTKTKPKTKTKNKQN